MKSFKNENLRRILTVQDLSCVGQCSLTVALPILSACGIETAVLPTAVLSTHTGGFSGFTFRDLSCDLSGIANHWKNENVYFDALYTGYLGNEDCIDYVLKINSDSKSKLLIVDPAMADNGKLYTGFDMDYVKKMAELCAAADIILPNITEACLLMGIETPKEYDRQFVCDMAKKMHDRFSAAVVITGTAAGENELEIVIYDGKNILSYRHERIGKGYHGTGDIYSSVFAGAYLKGADILSAAKIAADFTKDCIKNTVDDSEHWYGVKFEKNLYKLAELTDSAKNVL